MLIKATESNLSTPVYSSTDWAQTIFARSRFDEGKSTLVKSINWLVHDPLAIVKWADKNLKNTTFTSAGDGVGLTPDGEVLITIDQDENRLQTSIFGELAAIEAVIAQLRGTFTEIGPIVRWYYNGDGSTCRIPVEVRPTFDEAYPWLKDGVEAYIDGYLKASANVLLLIGPPGTGKTSFIRSMIAQSGKDAMVTYDQTLMAKDSMFAEFMSSSANFLILEDADDFLRARTDGNSMMQRFLNVSDGLVSLKKKLIFSVNLDNIDDIDSALMRPGRCHDVVYFRQLTRSEAKIFCDKAGRELPEEYKDSYTLAELFTSNKRSAPYKKRTAGFLT